MDSLLTALWTFANSSLGLLLAATLALWLLNRLYLKKPIWKQYEGTIIAAVKWVEKQIPDGTANTSAAKLDQALKYVLRVHEATAKRAATAKEINELTEGIQIIHAELEADDALGDGKTGSPASLTRVTGKHDG